MVQAVTILYFSPDSNYDSFREFFAISSENTLGRYLSGQNYVNLTKEEVRLGGDEVLFEIALYRQTAYCREGVVQFKPPVLPENIPSDAQLLLIRSHLETIINYLERMYGFPKDWSRVEMPEQARTLLELAQQLNSAQYSGASGSASD